MEGSLGSREVEGAQDWLPSGAVSLSEGSHCLLQVTFAEALPSQIQLSQAVVPLPGDEGAALEGQVQVTGTTVQAQVELL